MLAIKLQDLSCNDFLRWIDSLRKADGTKPGYSAINWQRSGLSDMYRQAKVDMIPTMASELSINFYGMTRDMAESAERLFRRASDRRLN